MIPTEGIGRTQLLDELEQLRTADLDRTSGRSFGYAYEASTEASELVRDVYASFLPLNGLDPTVFPSLLQLENEVVGMGAELMHAPEGAGGSFTSGGTESILLAIKAARDSRPDVAEPELILPVTGHAAFHKAGHYLGVRVVPVPVHAERFTAEIDAVRAAVTDRTIALVGSAPSYAHGVVDPIAELGALGQERGLWLHVDACIGFLHPFVEALGRPVPAFDFRVPGVTSLSVDLHKYGYAAKGASLLLYRDAALRRHQLYACADWTGYPSVNPTVAGSRSGGPVAAAWAVLRHLGRSGYTAAARQVHDATRALVAGIDAIDGLRVLGDPDLCLLAFTGTGASVFALCDELKARGWHVQAQHTFGGSPPNLHLTVTPANAAQADAFLTDLRVCWAELCAAPPADPPDLGALIAALERDGLPSRMAPVQEALNSLDPSLRAQLLTEFFQHVYAARG